MATAPVDPKETQTGTLEKMLLSTLISQCESQKDEVKISNHISIYMYNCQYLQVQSYMYTDTLKC